MRYLLLAMLALLLAFPTKPANAGGNFSDNTGKGITKTYANLVIPSDSTLVLGGYQVSNSSDSRLNGQLVLESLSGPTTVTTTLTDGFIRVMDYESGRNEFCIQSKGANYAYRDFAGYGSPCSPPNIPPTVVNSYYYDPTGKGVTKPYSLTIPSGQVMIAGGGQFQTSSDSRFLGDLVIVAVPGPTTVAFSLYDGFVTVTDRVSGEKTFCEQKRGASYQRILDLVGYPNGSLFPAPGRSPSICSIIGTPVPPIATAIPSQPTRLFLGEIRKDPPSYSIGYEENTGNGITRDFNGTVPLGTILIAGGGFVQDLSGLTPNLKSTQSVLFAVKGPFLFQVRIASGFIKIVADSDGRAEFCKRGDQAWRSGVPYRGYIVEYSGFPTNPCAT